MKRPNPGLIDDENPEWTEEDFGKTIPFSGLLSELQTVLSEYKQVVPDAKNSFRSPARCLILRALWNHLQIANRLNLGRNRYQHCD
jgi:hypothetical protein